MATSQPNRILPLLTAFIFAGMALLSPTSSRASDEKEKEKRHALVAGTVFTAEGFSLPGVKVTVKRKGDKKPKWEAVSDRRGEFAVRVPAEAATYEVATHSEERKNQTKTVKIEGEERVDVFFRLRLKHSEEEEDE